MDNKEKLFISITGLPNHPVTGKIFFDMVNEKVKLIDESVTGYYYEIQNNYITCQWYGKTKHLEKVIPLLNLLKDKIRVYLYPYMFNIQITIVEKGDT